MTEQPQPTAQGQRLLALHLQSLDLDRSTARERLETALGPQLSHKLLFALTPGRRGRCAA